MPTLPIMPIPVPIAAPPAPPPAPPPASPPASPAAAASADAASGTSVPEGADFNTVLARQLAGRPVPAPTSRNQAIPAGAAGEPAGSPGDANLPGLALPGKTPEKRPVPLADPAGQAAQYSLAALMAMPMVPAEPKPASLSPSGSSAASGASGQGPQGSYAFPAEAGLSPALALPAASMDQQSAALPVDIPSHFAKVLASAGSATGSNPGDPAGIGSAPLPKALLPDANASVQAQAQIISPHPALAPASAPASSGLVLGTPVGSTHWGEELGQKITWMTSQTEHSAELHLNPPDLGPLKVVLHVSGDQATALFTSPHAAVREAVEQALPQLKDMLASSGIMLGNASVGGQGSSAGQNGFSSGDRQAPHSGNEVIEVSSVAHGTKPDSSRATLGLVDTFA